MRNASKAEKKLQQVYNEKGYVVYRKEEDPEQDKWELYNLAFLFGDSLDTLCRAVNQGPIDVFNVRQKIKGYYDFNPFSEWEGRRVKVKARPLWGEGTIRAFKKVGNWYIAGVEFDKAISNGHGLRYRDGGNPGREGHCHWIWTCNLEFIPDPVV